MKLISIQTAPHTHRAGLQVGTRQIDLATGAQALGRRLPSTMLEFLREGEAAMEVARLVECAVQEGKLGPEIDVTGERIAPIPNPPSCRDGYAFRQHVATARRNRGVEMIPEFDQYPIFYFTNHHSITGEGEVVVEIDHLQQLDFELECAIVIGTGGRNIRAENADAHIAGFCIMNDWSARLLQMEEMKLNLGPAKGKDFATSIGPWLVTPDELATHAIKTPFGLSYNLKMTACHNGRQVSEGNLRDMNWTFAELIERASYGVELFPGDVIGSGTVGTGCYLELNGTAALEAKAAGTSFTPTWIAAGDTFELEIDGLGRLTNRIVLSPGGHSILARKKMTIPHG